MILTINSIDVSDYVEVGYRVDKQNIVKAQWEAIDGTEHQLVLGCKYTINCNLGHVPATTAAIAMRMITTRCPDAKAFLLSGTVIPTAMRL